MAASMTVSEAGHERALLECAVSSWLPMFRHLAHATRIVPVDQDIVDWLVSDGISVPADSQAVRGVENEASCQSSASRSIHSLGVMNTSYGFSYRPGTAVWKANTCTAW